MFIKGRSKIGYFVVFISKCMQLADFLTPVPESVFGNMPDSSPKTMINVADVFVKHMPELEGVHLAIVGVQEDRMADSHQGAAMSPDAIRKYFYHLVQPKFEVKLVDLGNIIAGSTVNDTFFALSEVVSYLLDKKIIPIILGGTQDLAYAQYTAYQGRRPNLQLAACDSRFDLKQYEANPFASNYLYKIIAHQPNYLFNIVHLANQNYFIEQESFDAFERMNFDSHRLGSIKGKTAVTEPLLRNADMFVFSMNSIRASDCPASIESNPNGLFGEEACQIMRYAGMGNELTSVGIFDMNALKDMDGRSAKLVSQMIWYFIEGFYHRRNDYPLPESNDYMIYRMALKNNHYEIVFYKHVLSDRWWMEVPYPKERSNQSGSFMVPCSYEDFAAAQNDEIPDRWMKAYQKLL
jgi:formiminoglutamase